ncbi:dihydrofolate reductase family protein [Streptomyces sp. NPDC060035]|uniref:dihydrofolate reductase family protein n=1 Tax=Streptomyces sp. NPDC060035 TaxID=3347044 RepID=UPI0036782374
MMPVSLDGSFEDLTTGSTGTRSTTSCTGTSNQELRTMSAFLHGRVTHELMAGIRPTADAGPSSTGSVAEFAGIWRNMSEIVFSRTLERVDWNTTVARDVAVEDILALNARPGGDMVLGGAGLAASFMQYDLIDEYRIHVPASTSIRCSSAEENP